MATPFLAAALLDNSVQGKRGAVELFAREPEKKMVGGGDRGSCTSLLESCSDVAFLDSEVHLNDSFLWQRSTSTLKCDEDACCGDGSPAANMLQCEDTLDDDSTDDEDATREWAPGTQLVPAPASTYSHEDAERTLGNELCKEQELGPFTVYPLLAEHRCMLVQWMRDVCATRNLSLTTFFSSLAHFDRFIRATAAGPTPPTLLQLVALTCIAVAAKSEQQQCAAQLLSLASDHNGNIYTPEDYCRMELHMFSVLQYRLRTPTIYTFVCLFMQRVLNRPQDGEVVPAGMEGYFRELVVRLAEMAAMDHELTAVPYSSLAMACLLVAETVIKGGQLASDLKTVVSLLTLPNGPDMSGFAGAVQRLYCMSGLASPS